MSGNSKYQNEPWPNLHRTSKNIGQTNYIYIYVYVCVGGACNTYVIYTYMYMSPVCLGRKVGQSGQQGSGEAIFRPCLSSSFASSLLSDFHFLLSFFTNFFLFPFSLNAFLFVSLVYIIHFPISCPHSSSFNCLCLLLHSFFPFPVPSIYISLSFPLLSFFIREKTSGGSIRLSQRGRGT